MSNSNAKREDYTGMEVAIETIYTRMGQLLGTPIKSETDAWRVAKEGIPAKRYVMLAKRLQLAPDAVGPESTMRRRVGALEVEATKSGARRQTKGTRGGKPFKNIRKIAEEPRLTPNESERLMRLTRVVSEATQLFGDEKAALTWLNTPSDFLHDEKTVTPMKLAETDSGARIVESMLHRTAHGFF